MARILIVEDEAQVRVLAESIQNAEYETLSASTVAEAMAFAESKERLALATSLKAGFRSLKKLPRHVTDCLYSTPADAPHEWNACSVCADLAMLAWKKTRKGI